MVEKFKIEITTPGKLAYSGDIEMAVIPGEDGELGVLAGHAETLTTLKNGVVNLYQGEIIKDRIFVAGGFSEITPSEVSILATEAEDLSQIDRSEIEQKVADAEIKFKVADTDFEKKLAQDTIDLNNKILENL